MSFFGTPSTSYSRARNLSTKEGAILFEANVGTEPSGTTDPGKFVLYRYGNNLKFWDGTSATTLGSSGSVANFSLNDAYDDGSTITVDSGSITLNASIASTALQITQTGVGADITGTSSTWAVTKAGAATFTDIVLGDNEAITLGDGSDATIAWNGTLLNVAGATDFDDAVTTQGAVTVGTTLTVTGGAAANRFVITAGDAVMSDGSLTMTDADNAVSLSVTNASATTIGNAADNGMVEFIADGLTTGTILHLSATEGTLNGGHYLKCWDETGDATVMSVGEDGLTTIAGNAAGTAALVLSLGDLTITDTDQTTITSVNGVGNTVEIISGGAVGAGKGTLVIDQAGTLNATGSLLRLEADGITDTNSPVAMYIDCAGVDCGGLTIDTDVATDDGVIIKGSGVVAAGKAMLAVTNDAAIADGAFYVDITSGANGAASTASYLLHVDAAHTNIEAIHVDAGNVLFDENLTVTGTTTQTGVLTCSTGITQTAVARTSGDGTGDSVIAAGTSMVDVTSGGATTWLKLPTPVVGHIIWLLPEGTGYEIRSNQPATVAINGGTDTAGESQVTAGMAVRLVCTSATTWIGTTYTAAGTEAPLGVAAD